MGTALAVREKTWDETRATQKWCACRRSSLATAFAYVPMMVASVLS
jgi:hypothetical protein